MPSIIVIRARRALGSEETALSESSSSSGVPRSMRSDRELHYATITSLPAGRVIPKFFGICRCQDLLTAEPLCLSGRALLPLWVLGTVRRGERTGSL